MAFVEKECVLITVKTYPTISRKHSELVCTAGIRKNGSWIRIYPIRFRELREKEKYKKFQWVEMEVVRNNSDRRPESYSLHNPDSIALKEVMGTKNGWQERKEYVLKKGNVYVDLDKIIQLNKSGELSLATFKPKKILDLVVEKDVRERNKETIEILEQQKKQGCLFPEAHKSPRLVDKLPYKFSYLLLDCNNKKSEMMIADWEIGMLFRKCLRRHGDKEKAILDVRKRYFDDFANTKDIHLFLGTILEYDGWSSNPFIIVGVFAPPIHSHNQLGLF